MFTAKGCFSGFSVDDLPKARQFYTETLGLKLTDDTMGLDLELPGGGLLFIYDKPDHAPAAFTVLNFVVDDIDSEIAKLSEVGIKFERYDNLPAPQDDKGVLRGLSAGMGPDIAWFKDPAGNVLSVIQSE